MLGAGCWEVGVGSISIRDQELGLGERELRVWKYEHREEGEC